MIMVACYACAQGIHIMSDETTHITLLCICSYDVHMVIIFIGIVTNNVNTVIYKLYLDQDEALPVQVPLQ